MAIGIVPAILLYIIACVWFTYTCVLSDASTSPMANLFTVKLPNLLLSIIGKIFGAKTVESVKKASEKALVVLYLVVVLGAWSIMFTYGYDFISKSEHVSSHHKISGYFVFIACMWSWRKASTSRPGYITERNLTKYDNYPYDNLLYVNKNCPTTGFRKLPRSKYDRFTNRHVARFDHFCAWVDNSIGEENYRFFLLFLAVHIGMCAYGAIVTYHLLLGEIEDKNLFNAIFFNAQTGQEVNADFWVISHFMFMRHFQLSAIMVLMGAMAVVLGLFMAFHLYMAATGITTNEYYKWRQVKKWHKKEKSKYEEAVKAGKIKSKTVANATMRALPDVDVGCVGPTSQPKEEVQDDGPAKGEVNDPGPYPANIYNKGIVENFKEIIFPRSLRADAKARFAAALRSARVVDSTVPPKTKST